MKIFIYIGLEYITRWFVPVEVTDGKCNNKMVVVVEHDADWSKVWTNRSAEPDLSTAI